MYHWWPKLFRVLRFCTLELRSLYIHWGRLRSVAWYRYFPLDFALKAGYWSLPGCTRACHFATRPSSSAFYELTDFWTTAPTPCWWNRGPDRLEDPRCCYACVFTAQLTEPMHTTCSFLRAQLPWGIGRLCKILHWSEGCTFPRYSFPWRWLYELVGQGLRREVYRLD